MIGTRSWAIAAAVAAFATAGCGGAPGSSGATPPAGALANGAAVAPASLRAATPAALGTYTIDPSKVFVAGISSGGFFAVQMQVAHSATFKGAAIYAGGVYWCSGAGQAAQALAACGGADSYAPTLTASEAYLDQQSAAGTIDPESNLRGQPVYLWSGTNDSVVKQAEMNDLQTEYQHYGANVFRYDNTFPAEHGWESPDGKLACGTAAEPYMIACDANGAPYDSEQVWMHKFFRHINPSGQLNPRNGGTLYGSIINFDQTAFGAGASNSMDTNGYVFVPRGCTRDRTPCGLLVAFHGCLQTQADIGTKFVKEAGINQWADLNHVIVLYPYAVKSSTVPYNPQGCWDWWGYDDENYATKSGTQIAIVYAMVRHMMGR